MNYLLVPFLVSLIFFLQRPRATAQVLARDFFRQATSGSGLAVLTLFIVFAFMHLQYIRYLLLINFEFRFFAPFFPVFLILTAVVIHSALRTGPVTKPAQYIIGILIAAQTVLNLVNYRDYSFKRADYRFMIETQHKPLAGFLREQIDPAEWMIVIRDAGAVPYLSGLKTIDFGRLNNKYLIRNQLSKQEIVDYFFSFNPGVVVLTSWKWDSVFQPWLYGQESDLIMADERFQRYVLAKKYRSQSPREFLASHHFLFLYLRADIYASLDPGIFEDKVTASL
jgi:succinate dehydrogenase hydrophobic anchor subunit